MRTIALLILVSFAFAQPIPEVVWDRQGTDPESHFGSYLFPLGDQNNDGYADWGVWGQAGDVGDESESKAEFFYGGNPPSNEPYLTIMAPDTALRLFYVGSIGDLNGDGFIDWFVGTQYPSNPQTIPVDIYYGGQDFDLVPDVLFTTNLDLRLLSPDRSFDFNGDEYDDIFIYDIDADIGQIFYGGNFMDTVADWIIDSQPGLLGQALPSSFGDVNSDGYSDFVSADANLEQVYVFLGGENPDTLPAVTLNDYDTFRRAILNDIDADGCDDLILAVPTGVTIHLGSQDLALDPSFELVVPGCIAQPRFHSVGDFNRDGYNDFAITDYICQSGWGIAYLFLGNRWEQSQAAFIVRGNQQPLDLIGITWAIGPGDINGDGIDDLLISATNGDFNGVRGRVVGLAGDTSYVVPISNTIPALPQELVLSIYPNPFNSGTRILLTLASAGDIAFRVYNVLGQEIWERELRNEAQGVVSVPVNAEGWASGYYFLQVEAGGQSLGKRVVLVR